MLSIEFLVLTANAVTLKLCYDDAGLACQCRLHTATHGTSSVRTLSKEDIMGDELYANMQKALRVRRSITVEIRDIERSIGDDWLIEFSAQVHQLGAQASPHSSDATLIHVTRI